MRATPVDRVCAISPYVPVSAPRHAGGAYFVEHARAVSRRFPYTILVPDTEENRRDRPQIPSELDVRFYEPSRAQKGRWAAWSRRLRYGLLPTEPGLRPDSEAADLIGRARLVEIHWARTSLTLVPQLQVLAPGVPLVAIPYDVASQLVSRRLRSTRWNAVKLRHTRNRERALYDRCQLVSVFSGKDRTLLEDIGVRCPVTVVDPPLDAPEDDIDRTGAPPTALFMGAMYRQVNANGVLWFARNVWPAVLERVPTARFVVVGADPPAEIRELASSSIEVVGWQDDLDPYFRAATVFVAPLLYGAGLKFKVPQAMLYGLPVVATSVAAEGIVEVSGPAVFGAVTDDAAETARAVARLLDDRGEALRIGTAARRWASSQYAFERRLRGELDRYAELIAGGASPARD